ncbi:ABC transporter ATP-binding protein [Aminivibrio sp.]
MLAVKKLTKSYGSKRVFENIDLEVGKGQLVVVCGKSGIGKSTLINVLSGIDVPNDGIVEFLGRDCTKFTKREKLDFRKKHMSLIFQEFNLLSHLSAFQNIEIAAGTVPENMLEKLGIGEFRDRLPCELSPGQQQRVAVARAIVKNPDLILADEPTGALDPESAGIILEALRCERSKGKAILVTTHGTFQTDAADRVYELSEIGLSPWSGSR